MKLETILFDLDGTLINTNELIIASFQHTLAEYDAGTYTREEIINFIGPPLLESLASVNAEKKEEMMATYRAFNIANHDHYVEIYPTVLETIKKLKQSGCKLGVVTTKLHDTAQLGLEITGLAPYFDLLIGLDDVDHAKPHPEPVLKAMDSLQANPVTTIMIGDNYHDVEAGHNAGVQTAGVAWAIKGEENLKQYNPDYILKEMKDLLTIVGVE